MTLNWSPNTLGGAHREVDDILEHILSDSERRRGAATDPGTGARRFRRPAPVGIFRPSRAEASGWGDEEPSRAVADQWGGGSEEAGQPAGERSGEGLVARTKDDGIYNISGDDDGEQIDPLSKDYNGIIANYFSVGLMKGGSASILYPILIVKAGATASFMMASHAAVCLFWSYKVSAPSISVTRMNGEGMNYELADHRICATMDGILDEAMLQQPLPTLASNCCICSLVHIRSFSVS